MLIEHQAKSRSGAITIPHIKISILIPIHHRHGPSVATVIEAADCGNVRELRTPSIQKKSIALVAAPTMAIPDQLNDGGPCTAIALGIGLLCRRHDLPPEETSQIIGPLAGEITIRHRNVLPAVIVDIDKPRAPSPAPHRRSRRLTDIAKATFAIRGKKRISPSHSL